MGAAEKLVDVLGEHLETLVRKAVKAELDSRSEPSDILDTEGAAVLLKLEPKTVSKYAAAGKIPGHRLGPEWRFYRSELLQWLKEQ
jgi:excisionase family DNA binding protein